MHMRSHYSNACASITPTKGVASEVKHSFGCPHTHCDAPTQNMLNPHISNPYFHTHSHIEKAIERKKNIDWGSLRFCAYLSVWNVHETHTNTCVKNTCELHTHPSRSRERGKGSRWQHWDTKRGREEERETHSLKNTKRKRDRDTVLRILFDAAGAPSPGVNFKF